MIVPDVPRIDAHATRLVRVGLLTWSAGALAYSPHPLPLANSPQRLPYIDSVIQKLTFIELAC